MYSLYWQTKRVAAEFDVPGGVKVKVVQVTRGIHGYITVRLCSAGDLKAAEGRVDL